MKTKYKILSVVILLITIVFFIDTILNEWS